MVRLRPFEEGGDRMLSLYTGLKSGWIHLTRRVRNEEGAVATEYGLLLVLIALAIIAGATLLGAAINGLFTDAATELDFVPAGEE
jgi:pilus assembly protein Flp/PilA